MPVALEPITIYQGATFRLALNPIPNTTPTNFTGCTARMSIKASFSSPPLITLTTENGGLALGGTAGTITVFVSAAQTKLLPVQVPVNFVVGSDFPTQAYVADLLVVFLSGDTWRYVNYDVTVVAGVTQ